MFQINKQKLSYSSMTLLTSDVKKKFQNLQKYFSSQLRLLKQVGHGRGCQEQMRRICKKIDKLNGINYILGHPSSGQTREAVLSTDRRLEK